MNNMLLFMRGPDDGQMRVALREGSGIHLDEFRQRLRDALPEKLIPWFTDRLQREGVAPDQAASLARQITFAFEPGDLVSEVMSFGSPAPIEIVLFSPELSDGCPRLRSIVLERTRRRFLSYARCPGSTNPGLPNYCHR